MMTFVEICKNLAVNLFWVLAATLEVMATVILIVGIVCGLFDRGKNEENNE